MVKKQYPFLPDRIVVVEHNGTRHQGTYTVSRGVVEVFYGMAKTQALVGKSDQETVARWLLREILDGNAWKL
jgi:hypothetical protein